MGIISNSSAPIYRGMNRAALDSAYNNSAAVVDSPAWLERWREKSIKVRAEKFARIDLRYGPQSRERLDYFSSGKAGSPLFVFIHGGYWQRNEKELFSFVAEGPHAYGIDVAVVGYTLAPEARLADIVMQINRSLTYLSENDEFTFDRRLLFVGGWSAGGHLTAAVIFHPAVAGGISISGIFDLEPIALNYLNEKLQLDNQDVSTLSPLLNLRQPMPPLRLFVGGNELPELQRQSEAYAKAAANLGLPVRLAMLPGHHHFSILDELATKNGRIIQELQDLISAPV